MPTRSADNEHSLFSSATAQRGAAPIWPQICRIAALGFLLGTTLNGCATVDKAKNWIDPSPKPQPVAAAPVAPAPPPATRPKRQVRDAHEPKAPEKIAAVDPDSLIGMDPPAVEKLLGAPAKIDKSGVSLVWTYASPGCAFQVFFYPDIKTSSFHALKYGGRDGNGGQIETSQTCIRNILTARSNGPS
jgi:hypothetical protein